MADEHPDSNVELGFLREQLGRAHQSKSVALLRGGDGGGTFDGMEPRVAKLEAAVEHIQSDIADIKGDVRALRGDARTDFRLLFGAIIVVALGLAGLMAKGFHWL
jgi:hypothetical protein